MTVLAIGTIAVILVGALCRHFCLKRRQIPEVVSPSVNYVTPLYDDIHLSKDNEQVLELELTRNVAYGPVSIPH